MPQVFFKLHFKFIFIRGMEKMKRWFITSLSYVIL